MNREDDRKFAESLRVRFAPNLCELDILRSLVKAHGKKLAVAGEFVLIDSKHGRVTTTPYNKKHDTLSTIGTLKDICEMYARSGKRYIVASDLECVVVQLLAKGHPAVYVGKAS